MPHRDRKKLGKMDKQPFALEEYKALRAEIAALVAETRKTEVYAVAGVAAMYSWFITAEV
jgi:hypothetical protein